MDCGKTKKRVGELYPMAFDAYPLNYREELVDNRMTCYRKNQPGENNT